MKTALVTQSNYIPWRGWFDMLRTADEAILLDSVQYTRRDWRNRNIIKTTQGTTWLTIPVETKGRYLQAIDETLVTSPNWAAGHMGAIEAAYRRASAFTQTAPWLFGLLERAGAESLLTRVNEILIRGICEHLGIETPLRRCTEVLPRDDLRAMDPTERLVALSQALGATRYLSGPAAQAYMDLSRFEAAGIEVIWMSYDGYPDYPQLWGAFEPRVSVVDLLLNTGADAARYLGKPVG